MKTYDKLFEKIFTYENFKLAYKNAIKGKKHYREVKVIERNRSKYLRGLLGSVLNDAYRVSDYEVFQLYTGHKWREIYKLPMRDRIVQHAIMIYLEPIFRETFIADTYASIKHRGTHLGLKRVKQALKKYGYKYCLKMDVHKCYPSLDKEILKQKLRKKFKDERLLHVLDIIIDSCDKGVPIGNYTSQYFNNFYFNDYDHYVKENLGIKAYFRYCDDIVILSNNKEELRNILEKTKTYFNTINVRLKDNYQIFPIESRGINFLGYVIYPDYVKLRKATKYNFIAKIRFMDVENLSDKNVNILGSYWGILKHGDCRNLWFTYIGMKEFKDLNINVHERSFVSDIVGYNIVIKNALIYNKRGEKKVRLNVEFTDKDNVAHSDVYVSSSAEMLIEAVEQLKPTDYPFKTIIEINKNKYYYFK